MDKVRKQIEDEIPRLRRYARALLRNPVDADDLVQEALLRALSRVHLWQNGTDLRAWLFTILHNQYVNIVRKSARTGTHVSLDAAVGLGSPGSQLDSIELRDLKLAMDKLPKEQRAVVLLIGLEGMSYDQVAEILHVPVGTVRSRLSRARDSLREMLDAGDRRKIARRAVADGAGLAAAP